MPSAVFHHVGHEGEYTNPLEQILAYEGVVTFDGAYQSVYAHREKLASKRPILFVQGGTVGRSGVMDWDQIGELITFYDFVPGWHGWSHTRLTELPDHCVIDELVPDKRLNNVKLYAYPHGDWDDRVRAIVKEMGYIRAYSTTQGNDDHHSLHREYLP